MKFFVFLEFQNGFRTLQRGAEALWLDIHHRLQRDSVRWRHADTGWSFLRYHITYFLLQSWCVFEETNLSWSLLTYHLISRWLRQQNELTWRSWRLASRSCFLMKCCCLKTSFTTTESQCSVSKLWVSLRNSVTDATGKQVGQFL